MAHGIGEPLEKSVETHVRSVDYPATREELIDAAEDGEAPAGVINFLKSLPRDSYASREEVERDFAEAARRMLSGPAGGGSDRRNIGRDLVEGPDARTHHP